MNDPRYDLARTTLGVMFLGGLTLASFWILQPFLPAFIWSVMGTQPMTPFCEFNSIRPGCLARS